MGRVEIPANRDIDALAPAVARACRKVLAGMGARGFKAIQFDTLRTGDRQAFLYGKGRTAAQLVAAKLDPKWAWPDCPDGQVTWAPLIFDTPHAYGLAFDVVENDNTPWTASQAFWNAYGEETKAVGMKWGGDWKRLDLPHSQWGRLPVNVKTWPAVYRDALAQGDLQTIWQLAEAM